MYSTRIGSIDTSWMNSILQKSNKRKFLAFTKVNIQQPRTDSDGLRKYRSKITMIQILSVYDTLYMKG